MDSTTVPQTTLAHASQSTHTTKSSTMVKDFWLPFSLAIFIICMIEAGINFLYKPDFWEKTTWLLHDPYIGEPFDRLIVYEKLKQLMDTKPDIISVGDSSGFFSIQPNIVNRYLHGLKYISLSTGANQGFEGYKGIAEYMIRHQPSIKYLVLNMYPQLIPSKKVFEKADLAHIEYQNLAATKSWITPPSASLSPYVKSLFFYHKKFHPSDLPSSHKVYLETHYSIHHTLGWVPEHDIPCDRINTRTPFYPDKEKHADTLFGLFEKSAIQSTLTDFAQLCRKHKIKLMIMFNPMPWEAIVTDENLFTAEKELEEFQKTNPDVIFLVDHLITPWDPAKFGMFNHVSRSYVHESSARMGTAIEKAIYHSQTLSPFKTSWDNQTFLIPSDVTVISKASEKQKLAALSYYLYTASTEKKYFLSLSDRVQKLLSKDHPFNWMMHDSDEKIQELKKKGITLSYDASKIDADIVTLKNGNYCGKNRNVQWIRLSGVMQFGFNSDSHKVIEPVNWPTSSNIIIPIIYEHQTYKFDGYCPALIS